MAKEKALVKVRSLGTTGRLSLHSTAHTLGVRFSFHAQRREPSEMMDVLFLLIALNFSLCAPK